LSGNDAVNQTEYRCLVIGVSCGLQLNNPLFRWIVLVIGQALEVNVMQVGNLFDNTAPPSDGERFKSILAVKNLVIERIVSSSKVAQTEYVQSQDEWVALLQGSAQLVVAGETVPLGSGDYLFLPAGTPHTVQSVSEGAVWLAIHLHEQAPDISSPALPSAASEISR